LNADVVVTSAVDYGLLIGADNITIDGNGYALRYAGAVGPSESDGIRSFDRTNVTIKNFSRISGFDRGVYIYGGASNTIENCRIESNMVAGVFAANSETLTLTNNVIREQNFAVDFTFNSSATSKLAGNTIVGGRVGILGGTVGTFTGNRLIHQAQSPFTGNRRLFRFTDLRRTGQPGESFPFAFAMYWINGSPSVHSAYSVRTVPPTSLTFSKSGNVVTGTFTPSRAGLHALVVEVTDPDGNTEIRTAQVLVGPTADRSISYYWTHYYPKHGQTRRMGYDTGAMWLTLPPLIRYRECGGWVQESPDQLPSLPPVLIRQVDFHMLFRFISEDADPVWGLERDVTFGVEMDRTVVVPRSWGDNTIRWGSLTVSNVNWSLDYPLEWLYLSAKFMATDPWVETGNPAQPSRNVFQYATTVSPEVRSVAGSHMLLLLAATAASAAGGGEELTVWGANDQAEVVLGNFRRPFVEATTRISAAGEAWFDSGVVNGEKTFSAVPLEISPNTNAVSVSVQTWTSSQRAWTEEADDAPGNVAHTLGGLLPLSRYRVTVNGDPLLTGPADANGSLSFVYDGSFPASFAVTTAPDNVPPIVTMTRPLTGTTQVAPATLTMEATASDSDGTVAKVEFYRDTVKLGEATTAPYSLTWSNAPAGVYSLTAKATDNDNAVTTSAAVIVTVLADTDGDGLPDVWEEEYFGGPTNAEAQSDADGDGMTNLSEFIAGTNPLDSQSRLECQLIIEPGGGVLVRFGTVTGRRYRVEYKDDLAATATWEPLMDDIEGDGTVKNVPDLLATGQRFYRVKVRKE